MGTGASQLPADLRKRLNAELASGERLLYAAQPDWRAEIGQYIALFAFGTFWSSIAFLFFGVSAASLLGLHPMLSDGKPSGLGLQIFIFVFSLPFVAIGLAFLSSPFFGVHKSRRTAHAVTDTRIINVYGTPNGSVESFKLDSINFIKRHDGKNGTGSLSIGYGVTKDADGDTRPLTTQWPGIPDARRAEALIRENARWVR